MSLDKLLLAFSVFDKDVLRNKVEIKSPLFKKFYPHENSSRAYVLLAPWHANPAAFNGLKNKIIKSGFSCLIYNFIPDILSPDVDGTSKYFEIIAEKIKGNLNGLQNQYGIKQFVLVGFSLSCVTVSMVASFNKAVEGIIFVVPGSSLARSLWSGLRTVNIKRVMEKNKVTLPYLEDKWENLAPKKYAEGFKDKRVKIILSQSDVIIPYSSGKDFADAVKRFVPETVIKENRYLGHYGTIWNFCLISKDVLL